MCCDTKQKIAQALRQLMLERPLKKITVQDLMERTQMKRRPFTTIFRTSTTYWCGSAAASWWSRWNGPTTPALRSG